MLSYKKNKHAQIGETLTWVVATIIIIFVLLIFIYASIALGKTKGIDAGGDIEESSVNWINVKTEMAYSLNNQNKAKIDEWIGGERNEE